MCGIWAIFGISGGLNSTQIKAFSAIGHRGPDAWRLEKDARKPLATLGFHRLAIVDILSGMQPMRLRRYPHTTLICNGQIYNYKLLQAQHKFPYETKSDVEAIIHSYHVLGIEDTVRNLDGVFAFCLVDDEKRKIYIARDPYGVRPMFKFEDNDQGILGISSEAKGLTHLKQEGSDNSTLEPFTPGYFQTWSILENGKVALDHTEQYFTPGITLSFTPFVSEDILVKMDIYEKTAYLLEAACRKRLIGDRRFGCLLSGGLDSSLMTAMIVKLAKELKLPYKIQTFSVGMRKGDSPDLAAARIVAKYLDTDHHEVYFDENEVKQELDNAIYCMESFDIAAIREGLPMYLLAKYIKENTDTTVVFSGEGSDEVAQGYIYFRDAPNAIAAHEESVRILSDIYLFDGLRADRSISAFGLELRAPYLDIQYTHHYLSVDPVLRQPQNGVEKHFLRTSVAKTGLLPDSILWRHKEAFGDGLASTKKSWHTTLMEIIAERLQGVSGDETKQYPGIQPTSQESKYFRDIFEKSFPGQHNFTPYYWMPKWVDVSDPSARFIQHYTAT